MSSFSGFRRNFAGSTTADSMNFMQRYVPVNDQDAATKRYTDDTIAGAAATPGGADTNVQYNDSGAFAGDAAFTFDSGTGTVTATNVAATATGSGDNVTAINTLSGDSASATTSVSGTTIAATDTASGSNVSATLTVSGNTVAGTTSIQGDDVTATGTLSAPAVVATTGAVVGGGSADASALITVNSTTQGLLPPRMTTAQRTGIGAPAEGLMVMDTDLNASYAFQGGAWTPLVIPRKSFIHVSFPFPDSQFVGTNDTVVWTTQEEVRGSNISYNAGTGAFTLAANRTYFLQANVHIFGSSQIIFLFTTAASTSPIGGGAKSTITPVDLAFDQSSGGTILHLMSTGGSSEDIVLRDNFGLSSGFVQPGSSMQIIEI